MPLSHGTKATKWRVREVKPGEVLRTRVAMFGAVRHDAESALKVLSPFADNSSSYSWFDPGSKCVESPTNYNYDELVAGWGVEEVSEPTFNEFGEEAP